MKFVLKECNELNGAMHMGDFSYSPSKYRISSFSYSVDDVVDMSNKIYTSESDNPFDFPLNGINTVGIGIIQGIASHHACPQSGAVWSVPSHGVLHRWYLGDEKSPPKAPIAASPPYQP